MGEFDLRTSEGAPSQIRTIFEPLPLRRLQQLVRLQAKHRGQALDVVQGDVASPSLDVRNEGAMQANLQS